MRCAQAFYLVLDESVIYCLPGPTLVLPIFDRLSVCNPTFLMRSIKTEIQGHLGPDKGFDGGRHLR